MKVVANNGFKGVRQNGRTPGSTTDPQKKFANVLKRY
jgi:hypothetical protein